MNDLAKAALILIPIVATGLVGAGLTYFWNLQLRRRELDFATASRFHALYGEFFAVWKLWNYSVRSGHISADEDVRRWSLMERACAAEAGIEATFTELVASRELTARQMDDLGHFRQIYQTLRESIRDGRTIDWMSSEHPEYVTFKELAVRIAQVIRSRSRGENDLADQRAAAWLRVTSNRYEKRSGQRP